MVAAVAVAVQKVGKVVAAVAVAVQKVEKVVAASLAVKKAAKAVKKVAKAKERGKAKVIAGEDYQVEKQDIAIVQFILCLS